MKFVSFAVAAFLGLSSIVSAAEMNEVAFKSWMKSITVDGKKFYAVEKDGNELNAMFINPANPAVGGRMIKIAPLKEFESIQKTVGNPQMQMGPTKGFMFKGMRTVAVDTGPEIGMLVFVEAKNINKAFSMNFPSKSSQAVIENGLVKTGVYQK
jgi:hypothetical protein